MLKRFDKIQRPIDKSVNDTYIILYLQRLVAKSRGKVTRNDIHVSHLSCFEPKARNYRLNYIR